MAWEKNTGRRSDICAQRASMIPYVRSQDLVHLRKSTLASGQKDGSQNLIRLMIENLPPFWAPTFPNCPPTA
jgi:hypothetical protein